MTTPSSAHSWARSCSAGPEVRADLVDENLLRLEPNERLWKLYCFWSAEGRTTQLRHRIYTKVKRDGRLALVTFAVHTPVAGRSVRSNIVRVPDLPIEALDRIIGAIVAQTRSGPDEIDEFDLSSMTTLEEQLQRIAGSE